MYRIILNLCSLNFLSILLYKTNNMNLHECNIHCHTMTPDKMDLLSIEDDPGKWMPFLFNLDICIECTRQSVKYRPTFVLSKLMG